MTSLLDEARGGDPVAAKKRLEVLRGFRKLEFTDDVGVLAGEIQHRLRIPHRARLDALHLAISVVYRVDYLLSWNFEHLVGANVKRTFAGIGRDLDLVMPVLCTPDEFMEV